jgi:AraC-like DNA-binding protein
MSRPRALAILVVDLSADVAPAVASHLAGASVCVAADPRAGLSLARERLGRFDLAFVDCAATDASALSEPFAFIATLSAEFPHLPIVGVVDTGGDSSGIIEAFRRGARDFVTRPVEAAELDAVAARLVPRRSVARVADRRAGFALVLRLVETRYMYPLSLGALASMAGVSRWHLCRTFRALTGRPFRAFVTELRLRHARELLLASTLTVTQIAHDSGFYDLSHLDRAFRQRFGVRPSALLRHRPRARRRLAVPSDASARRADAEARPAGPV